MYEFPHLDVFPLHNFHIHGNFTRMHRNLLLILENLHNLSFTPFKQGLNPLTNFGIHDNHSHVYYRPLIGDNLQC